MEQHDTTLNTESHNTFMGSRGNGYSRYSGYYWNSDRKCVLRVDRGTIKRDLTAG